MINFDKPVFTECNNEPVYALECFENGCFTTSVWRKKTYVPFNCETPVIKDFKLFYLHDKFGKYFANSAMNHLYEGDWLDPVCRAVICDKDSFVVIYDYYEITVEKIIGPHALFLHNVSGDTTFNETGIDNVRLFTNDWRESSAYEMNFLNNQDGKEVARYFGQAEVFSHIIALKVKEITRLDLSRRQILHTKYDEKTWQIFSLDGSFHTACKDIVEFIGDGNILIRAKDGNLYLHGFDCKKLDNRPVMQYKQFPNKRFVLTFADGYEQMFNSDATPLSLTVQNVKFLPDGCFVRYKNDGDIEGIYTPNGKKDGRNALKVDLAGSYYLLSGVLYNDAGKKMGANYIFMGTEGSCSLFEREGVFVELFNQNGRVAVFNKIA